VVNSRAVTHEVSVHVEASFNWSVGVDFRLSSSNSSGLSSSACAFVLFPGFSISALSVANSNCSLSRGVRKARVSNDTSCLEISPGEGEVSTVAAHVSAVAFYHILW